MSRLTDLIAQAKAKDPQLGADLEKEFRVLASRRAFGLNFERHSPEAVELPKRPVRKGDKVHILPPRGSTQKKDPRIWMVIQIEMIEGNRIAGLALLEGVEKETKSILVDDLVVVAEFRDVIYPGLASTGKVERGGDKPFHSVINGENYHVLKALTYTHREKVDAIYIDPPYNTGARDWKYNNDYVESEDLYRHSKWLAYMERRLRIAKELLKPSNSVLIVTIDEKEYLNLGLLLEQTFSGARIQMVSVFINPAAVARTKEFGRTNEYYFFVMLGEAGPAKLGLQTDWITAKGRTHTGNIRWDLLMRSGTNTQRERSPGTFYPFFLSADGSGIHSIGDALPKSVEKETVPVPPGTVAVWPIRQNGSEGVWQMVPVKARELLRQGMLRQGSYKKEETTIYYIKPGERKKIDEGMYEVTGKNPDGSIITSDSQDMPKQTVPGTQWQIASHDSSQYGSRLLGNILPDRKFPFPKSLYAVEDALRFFVAEKKNAVVVDFFAGSGTTAHALMRLNKQDNGQRQCILVTNNEVASDEQRALLERGFRPGDLEWECWGICDYITKPRVKAAITGRTPGDDRIKGDYKFTDEFPMSEGFEENAEFFTLCYETPVEISHDRSFERIAPLLWMRAGSQGRRIDSIPTKGWDVTNDYALLHDLDQSHDFCRAIERAPSIRLAYIVTDDDRLFQSVVRRMREDVEPVRLYESYLSNFRLVSGE